LLSPFLLISIHPPPPIANNNLLLVASLFTPSYAPTQLSENPQIDSFNVKDLNADPNLPYTDASFDMVTIVVSVDYLNKPREIFKEIGRGMFERGALEV